MGDTTTNTNMSQWRGDSESKSLYTLHTEFAQTSPLIDAWEDYWSDKSIRNSIDQTQPFESPHSDATTCVNSSPEVNVHKAKKLGRQGSSSSKQKPKSAITITIPPPWYERSRPRHDVDESPNTKPPVIHRKNVAKPTQMSPPATTSPPAQSPQAHPAIAGTALPSARTYPILQPTSAVNLVQPHSLLSALSPVVEVFEKQNTSVDAATNPADLHTRQVKRNSMTVAMPKQPGNSTRARSGSRGPAVGLNLFTDFSKPFANANRGRGKYRSTTTGDGGPDDETGSLSAVEPTSASSVSSSRASSRATSSTRTPLAQTQENQDCDTPRGRSEIRSSGVNQETSTSRQSVSASVCQNVYLPSSRSSSAGPDTARLLPGPTLADTSCMRSRTGILSRTEQPLPQGLPINPNRGISRDPVSRREGAVLTKPRRAMSLEPNIGRAGHAENVPIEGGPVREPFKATNFAQHPPHRSPELKRFSFRSTTSHTPDLDGDTEFESSTEETTNKTYSQYYPPPRNQENWLDGNEGDFYGELSKEYRQISRAIQVDRLRKQSKAQEDEDRKDRKFTNTPTITSPGADGMDKKGLFHVFNPIEPRPKAMVLSKEEMWG